MFLLSSFFIIVVKSLIVPLSVDSPNSAHVSKSRHDEDDDSLWTLDMNSFASLYYAQSSSSIIERSQIGKVAVNLFEVTSYLNTRHYTS